MSDRSPGVEWRSWMEDLDHLCDPDPMYARPAGLGSLGSETYLIEPYRIRSPHRIHIGDDGGIGARAFLSVIESYQGVEHDPSLRIGDNVLISTDLFVHCSGSIEIGDNVSISARVYIGDSGRDYDDPDLTSDRLPLGKSMPIKIEDGVGIGVGVSILPGVTVGERALISAGAVVTRDVPPRSVVFGNPARVIRTWDEETGRWRMGR